MLLGKKANEYYSHRYQILKDLLYWTIRWQAPEGALDFALH